MVDTFVADQVLAKVNLFPESHNQAVWMDESEECGTKGCIAGWACHFSDKVELVRNSYGETIPLVDGIHRSWQSAGAIALGIDEDTASNLFYTMNNEDAVHALKDILNEQ